MKFVPVWNEFHRTSNLAGLCKIWYHANDAIMQIQNPVKFNAWRELNRASVASMLFPSPRANSCSSSLAFAATVRRRGSVSESTRSGGAAAGGGGGNNDDEEFQSVEKRRTERRKSLDLGLREGNTIERTVTEPISIIWVAISNTRLAFIRAARGKVESH